MARYSFIGTEPYKVIKTGPGQPGGEVDPLTLVQAEMDQYHLAPVADLPRFHGGGVGYLAYDTVSYFEPRVPLMPRDPQGVPQSVFMFADTMLVFDHLRHHIKVVSHVRPDQDVERAYREATAKIDALVARLSQPLEQPPSLQAAAGPGGAEATSNFTRPQYEEAVKKCVEYIYAGDVIQVVNSQRFSRRTQAPPLQIYRALRSINPSPYMYFLHLDDFHIVGAAIETVAQVENGVVATHPIAGTRPRGRTPEEDEALEHELKTSEKQRAEHIMLVDLGRNDIGRVSVPGTVNVTQLMGVERFSHVMHLVSHVEGRLKPELTPYDALRSCFPRGHRVGRAQDSGHGDHRRDRGREARALRRRRGLLQLLRQHGHSAGAAHRRLQGRCDVRPGRGWRGVGQHPRRRVRGDHPQGRRPHAGNRPGRGKGLTCCC